MVKAYVLIEMVAGHSQALVDTLRQRGFARYAHRVTGPYDVIAEIQGPDLDAVSDVVLRDIHSQPGVVRTMTCVCIA